MTLDCVQWQVFCDTNTNANNFFNNINNAISVITSGWENKINKNSNTKTMKHDVDNPENNRWIVSGIMRIGNPDEKTPLINAIRGMGNSPHITGKIKIHQCSHFSWKCLDCNHDWDSKNLPPTICPSCGNSNPIKIVSAVEPCVVTEEIEVR